MKDPTELLVVGDSRRTEPWIWRYSTLTKNGSEDWSSEVSRVRWFKTRAVAERWREEILLRDADFDRIYRSYTRLTQAWASMASAMKSENGKQSYCFKISNYYQQRAAECWKSWNEAHAHLENAGVQIDVPL